MLKMPHNAPDGFDWVVRGRDWKWSYDALRVFLETAWNANAEVVFWAVSDAIWNVRFIPAGIHPELSYSLVTEDRFNSVKLTLTENKNEIAVRGPKLSLIIQLDPWMVRFVDAGGNDIMRENPSDVDGLGRLFILPLGFVKLNGKVRETTQSFHLKPDEHLYGLGEKFTRLDKVGQRIVTWTEDALGSTGEHSHKNVPFIWSTRGYGLFVDSTSRITWELGTVSTQSYTIRNENAILDIYLIHGPDPAAILSQYSDLTGHAPLPPKWSFGLWVSSGGTYRDQEAIQKLVDGLQEHEIAADVVHIDTWWMRWRKYADFQWNRQAFPHPELFIRNLHKRGLKLSLWIQPYISKESELFEYGKSNHYFVKRPDGEVYVIDYGLSLAPRPDGIIRTAEGKEGWNAPVAIIDLTNQGACRWFQDLMRPVLRQGADVLKTDFGEDIPEDAVFSNGETGATLHNLYPLLYNKAVADVTEQENGYSLVWARSAFAGSQKYPLCWSADPAADWDSLAATIRGGLSLGMSGIPFWSNDIGGYRGKPSSELYIRWAQFGLLCSHSRMHGDSPREPWRFGEEALRIVRNYIQLRYRLFPYLYSTAFKAARKGVPVIRAMPLAFPKDPNCYGKDLQFMLGEWLLVAPVYQPGTRRVVYFPSGQWIDCFDGRYYTGPANVEITAPLEKLPLFVRKGAILPMVSAGSRIPEKAIDPLILEIYPAGYSHFVFYEDEGETEFACKAFEKNVELYIKGKQRRRFIVRLRDKREIHTVTIVRNENLFNFERKDFRRIDGGVEIKLNPLRLAGGDHG